MFWKKREKGTTWRRGCGEKEEDTRGGCGVEEQEMTEGGCECGDDEEKGMKGVRGKLGESVTDFLLILLFSDGSLGERSSEGGVGEFGSFFVRAEGMVEGRAAEAGTGVGAGWAWA